MYSVFLIFEKIPVNFTLFKGKQFSWFTFCFSSKCLLENFKSKRIQKDKTTETSDLFVNSNEK